MDTTEKAKYLKSRLTEMLENHPAATNIEILELNEDSAIITPVVVGIGALATAKLHAEHILNDMPTVGEMAAIRTFIENSESNLALSLLDKIIERMRDPEIQKNTSSANEKQIPEKTYIDENNPLWLDDEEVRWISFEDNSPVLEAFEEYCPNKKDEIFEDIFPYWIVYEMLKVVGWVERIQEFDDDRYFDDQVLSIFPELPAERIEYILEYTGNRIIGNIYYSNIWWISDVENCYDLPTEVEFGSDEYNKHLERINNGNLKPYTHW